MRDDLEPDPRFDLEPERNDDADPLGLMVAMAAAAIDKPREQDGIPITGHHGGQPLPDLARIPRERWREVLVPLTPRARKHAMNSAGREIDAAMELVGELEFEDMAAEGAAWSAQPTRMPVGAPPRRGASRQVSFRLGPDEHARLEQVARIFALRAGTLARLLTVRGVERALYEERKARAEPR